ncbi:Arylsulfatase [Pontiella desulfatans]|uniref:Arylsulfatase n=1 Tax=Pontiella desulfatans TaxID=2750659 RepID=A0A6C2TZT2_PONDE|nr:sulfatase-like hydrolase/transferase [Pontiella desulfatans]SPS73691.1 sulfatase S1_25 [Kiritimatiellales bacterium]VGO12676.1 Arylsulfatase [Pontiella desulfatans]
MKLNRIIMGLTALVAAAGSVVADEKPNIVFVLVDDQRNDTLGCAGHPVIQTPNIDRLAAQGVRFENAFVNTSICMASRATIFTGLTQRSHNYRPADPQGSTPVSDAVLMDSFPTQLRQAGYYTGFFGKNHVGFKRGTSKAFDTMFDDWRHLTLGMKKQPDGTMRHSDELVGDESVEFLRQRPTDKPFMLYMSMTIAHAKDSNHSPGMGHYPWPKAVDGMYEDIDPARPRLDDPAIYESMPGFLKESLNRTRYFWRWDTPEKYRTNMRAYYRMLSGMDGIVGRVLAELETQGVRDNTIVIYTADNGYYMGERGLAGKWSHFEESLRVPLIIADPRLPKENGGRVEPSMVMNLDLPTTMLDLAGVPVPEQYQGESLTPFLTGNRPAEWRTECFVEHHQLRTVIPSWAGVRDERYVYARYDRQNPPYEFLHDLKADPDQLKNFVNNPEYAEILDRLRSNTDGYIREYTGGSKPPSDESAEKYTGGEASFNGRQSAKLADVPALSVESKITWRMEVKIHPDCAPGAILMGNRKANGRDYFFKITPSKGVQLFKDRKLLLKIPARIPKGVWTEVRVVKEGPQFTLFINGEAAGTARSNQPLPAMPCYLGGDPATKKEFARCSIRNAYVEGP